MLQSSRCWSRILVGRTGPSAIEPDPVQLARRRPEPVSGEDRGGRVRPLLHDLRGEVAVHAVLRRLPARAGARRRAPSALAVRRLRAGLAGPPPAALDADRLHAARLHADLPPRWQARANDGRVALPGATPRRCHECFPESSEQDFFLRKRFIRAHLDHVDLFLAPSHFLLERYVDWGIPREKIRFEECGRSPALPVAESRRGRSSKPARVLRRDERIRLRGHRDTAERDAHRPRAGARRSPVAARRELDTRRDSEFSALLQEAGNVSFVGSWDRAGLPRDDEQRRLGGRALALVGGLAARDPGRVPLRAPRDLQRHRRAWPRRWPTR